MDFHLWPRVSRRLLCFVFFIFCGTSASLQAEKHSLYYIYTGLSKAVDRPGIYEFTAMGLLDDRQIDYYNSKEKRKIPTQHWMKEKMQEDYWEKGTQSRKSKEQWFHVNIKILMDRMRHNDSAPPDVRMFAKTSISDKSKLKLTCLATGFYPKDVMMIIWKNRRYLPKNKMKSTGIRPNHDGSYQLRKSVEIQEEERADYECLVSHRTLEESIIVELDGINCDCSPETQALLIGVVIGVVLMLSVNALVAYILYKNDMLGKPASDSQEQVNECDDLIELKICGSLKEAPIF